MKRVPILLALVLVMPLALLSTPVARAQAVVVDPTNLVQNVLIALRSLQQIANQIRQLQNEAQMLVNQARQLKNLDFNVLEDLRAALLQGTHLIAFARGLTYEIQALEAQLEQLYPEAYDAAISVGELAEHAHVRRRNVLEGLRTTLRMQTHAAKQLLTDEGVLADLVEESQLAVGQLQAMQATNQLLALAARQAIQAQQLQVTQGRVEAAEQARLVAEEARSRALRRRFRGEGVRYTPHPVDFYGH